LSQKEQHEPTIDLRLNCAEGSPLPEPNEELAAIQRDYDRLYADYALVRTALETTWLSETDASEELEQLLAEAKRERDKLADENEALKASKQAAEYTAQRLQTQLHTIIEESEKLLAENESMRVSLKGSIQATEAIPARLAEQSPPEDPRETIQLEFQLETALREKESVSEECEGLKASLALSERQFAALQEKTRKMQQNLPEVFRMYDEDRENVERQLRDTRAELESLKRATAAKPSPCRRRRPFAR